MPRVSTNAPGRRAPRFHGPDTILRATKLPPLKRPRKVLPTPPALLVPERSFLIPDALYAQFGGALR